MIHETVQYKTLLVQQYKTGHSEILNMKMYLKEK